MTKLDCWLPQKEMFGRFSLDSIVGEGDSLHIVVSNEVFEFSIRFSSGVGAYSVAELSRCAPRVEALSAEYEVLMRGNTFFKLTGDAYQEALGKEHDVHYVIAGTNAMVDILSAACPSVSVTKSRLR